MIDSLQFSGVHTDLTKEVEEYVAKKIGGLDRYIPKKAQTSLRADVKLKEQKVKNQDNFTCEVILHLPKGTITVHEKANTALASIDLAEAKLKIQLKRYKEKHAGPRLHRRLIGRLKRG